MAQLRASVAGVDQLVGDLARAADYCRRGMPDAAADAAQLVAAEARATTAPRRTGLLASRIDSDGSTVLAGVPYARPVHARLPFVTLAKSRTAGRITEIYAADARRLLDK